MDDPYLTIPALELRDEDDNSNQLVELLREFQFVLLRHPVASQALFSSLVEEGRQFARTQEGGNPAVL